MSKVYIFNVLNRSVFDKYSTRPGLITIGARKVEPSAMWTIHIDMTRNIRQLQQ